jgi:O-antigen ligase
MAQLGVISLVLALGPFAWWKRIVCFAAGCVFVYAMSISGTRGALFALLVGMFVSLLINKNIKFFIIGSAIVLGGFFFLKYTTILQGNAQIRRMRSALNPEDASFNVRLANQARFKEYLRTRPFGGGLGAVGYAGYTYNKGTYLSTLPPDSYWVKVWAMYGIVGLCVWLGIMMYILGKCCGIVWNIKNQRLRFKLGALTAGAAGIFFSSYGNEVMNNLPSAMILYVSWALVFLGPKMDKESLSE